MGILYHIFQISTNYIKKTPVWAFCLMFATDFGSAAHPLSLMLQRDWAEGFICANLQSLFGRPYMVAGPLEYLQIHLDFDGFQ